MVSLVEQAHLLLMVRDAQNPPVDILKIGAKRAWGTRFTINTGCLSNIHVDVTALSRNIDWVVPSTGVVCVT